MNLDKEVFIYYRKPKEENGIILKLTRSSHLTLHVNTLILNLIIHVIWRK